MLRKFFMAQITVLSKLLGLLFYFHLSPYRQIELYNSNSCIKLIKEHIFFKHFFPIPQMIKN